MCRIKAVSAVKSATAVTDNHIWSFMKGTKLKINVMIKAPANRYTGKRPNHTELEAIRKVARMNNASGIRVIMAANVSLYFISVLISSDLQTIHNGHDYIRTREETVVIDTINCDKVRRTARY